jgi:Asp-tRNA(Asn)/Glu-tRNA(Gln) amidotransferase A subunit family amidase
MSHPKDALKFGDHNHSARRRFLAQFSAIGLTSTLFPGLLWGKMQEAPGRRITPEMIQVAEQMAGLEFNEAEREAILERVNQNLERYQAMRKTPLENSDSPALEFNPVLPGMQFETQRHPFKMSPVPAVAAPVDLQEVAFWPVTHLAQLVRSRQVSSLDLTRMYLDRLKKYDQKLRCVITLTEDLALRLARRADQETAAGRYRGPLHGIPWGVKDLAAARGYKTTWGAAPYQDQVFDFDSTVVERLEEAGAVLVAKLSTGEMARGDIWFGGKTMNPWNPTIGPGGSSAGSAAATAAGLVGFSLGTETRGSISRPSTNCGLSGLRPTFGRVSRYGVMALTFSMDKVGPICRTVEDCAVVFNALQGPDGKDLAVVDHPFNWDPSLETRSLRLGYVRSAFEATRPNPEEKANDEATLEKLESMGFDLRPVEFPDYPEDLQRIILYSEAAAAFDELTRSGRDKLLAIQDAWPKSFREARMIPAVEYIQALRLRKLLMKEMEQLFSQVDALVVPTGPSAPADDPVGKNIPLTNMTGHPAVVVPNGFTAAGIPSSITWVGRLYREAEILALAKNYQDATGFHENHPEM